MISTFQHENLVDTLQDKLLRLSRTMAHALRHKPWLYELELDENGWVDAEVLLSGLRGRRREWRHLTKQDLVQVIETSSKQRFELRNGLIRALYGHSTSQRLQKVPAEPPVVLYHGTGPQPAQVILAEGLKPMGRQYVHLSTDRETAYQVGCRKARNPVILEIAARQAYSAGVSFYKGNEQVWLADYIPVTFLRLTKTA